METEEEVVIDEVETPEDNTEEITVEQALEWKRKAEQSEKAEKKVIELKRELKSKKENEGINPVEEVKKILAEEKFYDKNPEANAYREKIDSYTKKGLTLDEAYTLATKQDKVVEEQREVYGKPVANNSGTDGISFVNLDTFDKMTELQQNEYTDKMKAKYGVVKFK